MSHELASVLIEYAQREMAMRCFFNYHPGE